LTPNTQYSREPLKPILVVSIDISDGHSDQLVLLPGDYIELVAKEFVTKNNLSNSVLSNLVTYLLNNIDPMLL
jgi:hypothetical protein